MGNSFVACSSRRLLRDDDFLFFCHSNFSQLELSAVRLRACRFVVVDVVDADVVAAVAAAVAAAAAEMM